MPKWTEYSEKTTIDDTDILLEQDATSVHHIKFLNLFDTIKAKLNLGGLANKSKVSQEDLETALSNLISGKLTASGIANDLTTTDLTKVLAAPQGKTLLGYIGTLTSLSTVQKTNLVGAINELVTSLDSLNRKIYETKTILSTDEMTEGKEVALSESYKNFNYVIVRLSLAASTTVNLADFVVIPTEVSSIYTNQISKRLAVTETAYAHIQCGFTDNTTFRVGYLRINGSYKVYATVYGVGRKVAIL